MEKRPYPIIPAKSDNVFLYIFPYDGDDSDFTADKIAYNTELKKRFMIDLTTPMEENGLGLTGSNDLLCSAPGGGVLRIQNVSGATAGANVEFPIVFYKGEPIPESEIVQFVKAGCVIDIYDGIAKYGTTEEDFIVYISGHIWGILVSADVGGVTLPIESTSYKAVGHTEAVVSVTKRGDTESTGTISVITSLTSLIYYGLTAPVNLGAGSELFYKAYGSDWKPATSASFSNRNKLTFNTKPIGICLVEVTGKRLNDVAQGHLWGRITCIYNCDVTSISSPQNITNDAGDPILQNIEYRSNYLPEVTTVLTNP